MSQVKQLLREIEAEVRHTRYMTGRATLAPRVLEAMTTVPRHEFVPDGARDYAYDNRPLPIGDGQTISQPYIVALMTDLLDPEPEDVVLEVGTGSGYQAAVLSRLVHTVYSVEVHGSLSRRAEAILRRLGYDNVICRVGDGYDGWPEKAPFDGILVTAAAPAIPPALVEQLKPGGRMVIPVGAPLAHQELMVVAREEDGTTSTRKVLDVAFVPLTRSAPRD
ncbi:MAG: protein-L-isoaspartate(D-aspartate) O-methyltransferase [Gammaproteobacteria bacterium]|nr:protein-L-isoaspartate(D-aspartate) O-methyltransferase [Gammaproteobacteria bacterium]